MEQSFQFILGSGDNTCIFSKLKDIVIKPADKGSSLVLMPLEDYLGEANRQFSNTLHYRPLDSSIAPQTAETVSDIIHRLFVMGYINEKHLKYLLPNSDKIRERRFYLLPKIHKDSSKWFSKNMPPGRPVVSDCSSETYTTAELVNNFINPLAQSHPSYIKDTQDFLQKIKTIQVPKDAFLITLDVQSLYTNIEHKKGIQAIKNLFEKNKDTLRPDKEILQLLKIQLEKNDMYFNKKFFLQIWGTSMGKTFSPGYADTFLAEEEARGLELCPDKPLVYLRYLDDIFIIWAHSLEKFQNFMRIFNSLNQTIKFEENISKKSIDFLDVTIFKGKHFEQTGYLDTKTFFKKTDTHELLHTASYHPQHTFKYSFS